MSATSPTHFDLAEWTSVRRAQGLTHEQMFLSYLTWFIDTQAAQRKPFGFAQNPLELAPNSGIVRELSWLELQGYSFDPNTTTAVPNDSFSDPAYRHLVVTMRTFWGRRMRQVEARAADRSLRGIAHEAFLVFANLDGDTVRIGVEELAPRPRTLPAVSCAASELGATLAELDATLRAALPPTFVAALDEAERRDLTHQAAFNDPNLSAAESSQRRAQRYAVDAAPEGAPFPMPELPKLIVDTFGTRARFTPPTPNDPASFSVELDGALTFGVTFDFSRDHQEGDLHMSLHLAGRGVSPFGRWLTAAHNDERSIRQLLERVDEWYRVRAGVQTTIPVDI